MLKPGVHVVEHPARPMMRLGAPEILDELAERRAILLCRREEFPLLDLGLTQHVGRDGKVIRAYFFVADDPGAVGVADPVDAGASHALEDAAGFAVTECLTLRRQFRPPPWTQRNDVGKTCRRA